METGKVKFYLAHKGYGFIDRDEENTSDVFFHTSGTLDLVQKDDIVEFEIEEGKRGLKAINVKRVKNNE